MFFAQLQIFRSTFANKWKNENSGFNLAFKGYPHLSIPPLIFATLGIIKISGHGTKVQSLRVKLKPSSENLKLSCQILKLEIKLVLSKKKRLIREKKHLTSHFPQFSLWDYESIEYLLECVHRVTLCTSKNVHSELGGGSPVGIFGKMSWNLTKNLIQRQVLEFSANQFSGESNTT